MASEPRRFGRDGAPGSRRWWWVGRSFGDRGRWRWRRLRGLRWSEGAGRPERRLELRCSLRGSDGDAGERHGEGGSRRQRRRGLRRPNWPNGRSSWCSGIARRWLSRRCRWPRRPRGWRRRRSGRSLGRGGVHGDQAEPEERDGRGGDGRGEGRRSRGYGRGSDGRHGGCRRKNGRRAVALVAEVRRWTEPPWGLPRRSWAELCHA